MAGRGIIAGGWYISRYLIRRHEPPNWGQGPAVLQSVVCRVGRAQRAPPVPMTNVETRMTEAVTKPDFVIMVSSFGFPLVEIVSLDPPYPIGEAQR